VHAHAISHDVGRVSATFSGLEFPIVIGNVGCDDEAICLQKRDELGLPPSVITMPRILKDGGYDTALIGQWHLGYLPKFSPTGHGFDEFYGILGDGADYFTHKEVSVLPCFYHSDKPIQQDGYVTDLFPEPAVAWLKQQSNRPFFLYPAYNAPHLPLQGPDDNGIPRDDHSPERYRKVVERMEWGVGEVLSQLNPMGASENTLVVFTSDNGRARGRQQQALPRFQELATERRHPDALPGAISGLHPTGEHHCTSRLGNGLAAGHSGAGEDPAAATQESGWGKSAALVARPNAAICAHRVLAIQASRGRLEVRVGRRQGGTSTRRRISANRETCSPNGWKSQRTLDRSCGLGRGSAGAAFA
jgi:arylsulfatase A-like enzyme